MQKLVIPDVEKKMNFYGSVYALRCPACNRIESQPQGLDIVFENQYFRVHQDYSLPIPYMMVIETKRHINSVSELNTRELSSYVTVMQNIRNAMLKNQVHEVMFVQDESSSHFHLWLLPIYSWMKDQTDGRIRNLQDIFDYAKTSMKTRNCIQEVEEATQRLKITLGK